MEKIEFSSNVEFVAKAKALLESPDGYLYAYDAESNTCQYRTKDNRRCIAGRMFFGHIPEDNSFWRSQASITIAVSSTDLRKDYSFLDWYGVVRNIQKRHDYAARPDNSVEDDNCSWERIEQHAQDADKRFAEEK